MSGKYQGIFSYIYILGKLSGKNQGICFTKLSGHPVGTRNPPPLQDSHIVTIDDEEVSFGIIFIDLD